MGTKYFVAEAYRYRESQKWEFKAVNSFDTLYDAKQSFHGRKAAITKESNDYAMVILFDMFGNKILSDYDNTYVEPNEEE